VFDESLKAIFDAHDFDAVLQDRRFRDSANDRVEAGAIAATSKNAESSYRGSQ
jgi:hypothetical protein